MTPMSFLLPSLAYGASATVRPGDNLNSIAESLQPGDVITFSPGVYEIEETIRWTGTGSADAPIEFRAQQVGTATIVNTVGGYAIELTDSAYVNIIGLNIEAAGDIEDLEYTQPSGIYVRESNNIRLEDNTVRNVWGTALRLDGNISKLTAVHNDLGETGDGSGIYVGCGDGSCWMQDSLIEFNLIRSVARNGIYLSPGTQGCTLQHNVIYQAGENGIVIPDTQFGPQNTVFGNAIWQTEGDGMYIVGSALVQNNLIFEIGGDGIEVRNDYEGDSLQDLQISHNTIARTDGWGAELNDWFDRENLVFANNAIANPTGYGMYWEDWLYQEDNYGYGYSTTPTGDDTDNYISNNVVTGLVEGFDPLIRSTFVIPGGGITDYVSIDDWDFYPTSNSQLRDKGDANGNAYIPQDDFNGTARDGQSPDVGAYEYDGEGNPGWVVQESFKDYSPSDGRNANVPTGGCCGGGASKQSDTTTALLLLPLGLLTRLRRRA